MIVWANKCRPNVSVDRAGPLSEFNIGMNVAVNESDECGGEVNQWFIRVKVEDNFDTDSARLVHRLPSPADS